MEGDSLYEVAKRQPGQATSRTLSGDCWIRVWR